MSYKKHPLFNLPRPNAKIWRYMDFAKYVSLLKKQALWFCRADKFTDQFEGSLSSPTHKDILKSNKPYNSDTALNKTVKDIGYRSYEEMMRVMRYQTRKDTAMNCWHISDHESASLWELYSAEEGISIYTTPARLISALGNVEEDIYIGKIRYVNYATFNFGKHHLHLAPYMHKRLSFRHERELRALIQRGRALIPGVLPGLPNFDPGIKSPGVYLPVDLTRLIAGVFINPRAPRWFYELVCSISNQLGVRRTLVKKSEMGASPIY